MQHPNVSKEEMLKRVVRFSDYTKENAVPLMFIDSLIPGHHRLNYAVIGDTASENPDFQPILTQPHKFQIGMFKAMPNGNGPAYHTHDYIEIFLPLEGKWRFYWGNDPEADPEDEVILEKWDLISFPRGCGAVLKISMTNRPGVLPSSSHMMFSRVKTPTGPPLSFAGPEKTAFRPTMRAG